MEIQNINTAGYQGQGSSNAGVQISAPKASEKVEVATAKEHIIIEEKNNGPASNSDQEKSGAASMSALKEAVEKINSAAGESVEAKFGIHEKTNRVTIKMVDKETQKVVKEFPADETLDLIAKAWELAGILVDERR